MSHLIYAYCFSTLIRNAHGKRNRGLIIAWESSSWTWNPIDEWRCRCMCRCRCRCTHSLPRRWIKMSGQLHDPPDILQNKSSGIRRIGSEWNPDLVCCRLGEETTNTLPLPANEPLFHTCPARASSFYCLIYSGLRTSSFFDVYVTVPHCCNSITAK